MTYITKLNQKDNDIAIIFTCSCKCYSSNSLVMMILSINYQRYMYLYLFFNQNILSTKVTWHGVRSNYTTPRQGLLCDSVVLFLVFFHFFSFSFFPYVCLSDCFVLHYLVFAFLFLWFLVRGLWFYLMIFLRGEGCLLW